MEYTTRCNSRNHNNGARLPVMAFQSHAITLHPLIDLFAGSNIVSQASASTGAFMNATETPAVSKLRSHHGNCEHTTKPVQRRRGRRFQSSGLRPCRGEVSHYNATPSDFEGFWLTTQREVTCIHQLHLQWAVVTPLSLEKRVDPTLVENQVVVRPVLPVVPQDVVLGSSVAWRLTPAKKRKKEKHHTGEAPSV